MISGGPQPQRSFEEDVEQSYVRLRDRVKVLRAEGKLPAKKEFTEENSNLTPEQAVVFRTFPKIFQEALMEGDMELINQAFSKMDKKKAEQIMQQCQKTGLITVLSEDEAKKMMEEDEKLRVCSQ